MDGVGISKLTTSVAGGSVGLLHSQNLHVSRTPGAGNRTVDGLWRDRLLPCVELVRAPRPFRFRVFAREGKEMQEGDVVL